MQPLPPTLAGIGLVALGGALGALLRFGIASAMNTLVPRFPLGTLTVNTAGCLAIGVLMYFAIDRQSLAPNLRLFLMVGVLGALTTFSAFGYETIGLLRQQQIGAAILNIAANVLLSLAAVWLGWQCTRYLWS